MSASTMIFRLCDEDQDLDLAAEPVHPAAEGSHHGRSRQLGFRHGEQPSWDPSSEPRTVTWADREPWTAEPPEGPSPVDADEAWEVDPDTTASSGMFDWDGLEPDGRDRPIDGDERPGWTGREPARALRTAASSRSWFSDRVLALGAIAIVALLVVAISHSARPAGRGSVGQRPLEAAAVGVSTKRRCPPPPHRPAAAGGPLPSRRPHPLPSRALPDATRAPLRARCPPKRPHAQHPRSRRPRRRRASRLASRRPNRLPLLPWRPPPRPPRRLPRRRGRRRFAPIALHVAKRRPPRPSPSSASSDERTVADQPPASSPSPRRRRCATDCAVRACQRPVRLRSGVDCAWPHDDQRDVRERRAQL